MDRYKVGRGFQLVGLLILPFSVVSEIVEKIGLGVSMLVSLLGVALFYVGYQIQNRPAS